MMDKTSWTVPRRRYGHTILLLSCHEVTWAPPSVYEPVLTFIFRFLCLFLRKLSPYSFFALSVSFLFDVNERVPASYQVMLFSNSVLQWADYI